MPATVEVLQPGPARSRLEVDQWVRRNPCVRCGGGLVTHWEGLPRTPGPEVWEVDAACSRCGTIHRCLFAAGPGWRPGPHRGEDIGERRSMDARLAVSEAPSAILTEATLVALLTESQETLDIGCPEGAPDAPTDADWRFGALAGAGGVLGALIELEKLAAAGRATLRADHDQLRDRATRVYVLAGGSPPPARR